MCHKELADLGFIKNQGKNNNDAEYPIYNTLKLNRTKLRIIYKTTNSFEKNNNKD